MSGLEMLVTASERAVSSTMDSSDGNGDVGGGGDGLSPRGSKRPATEESSPGEKGVVAAHDNNINRAATTAAEREYNKVQEHQEGGRREEHGGEEKQSNLDADGRDQEGDLAAMRGDLEFCKRKEGLKFTTRAMDGAAAAGHLDVVIWLHEHGAPCTTDAMDFAAQQGRLDIIQWLHDKRTEGCSGAALAMAAGRGHLGAVQWFYGNGIPGDISKAIEKAQEGGHVEVVEWLKSHSSNKKSRVDSRPGAGAMSAGEAGASPSTFQRQQQMVPPPAPGAKSCLPMGMFGSPFGNFCPVNGIVLPGTAAHEMAPKQAATGIISSTKPSSAKQSSTPAGSTQRLRSNMLRSPELTLATSGKLSTTDERQLKAVMEFRKAYSAQALEGSNIPKDPFTLFAVWFEEARIARATEPGAMCLSTVGPTGRPSARYVMLQGFDKRGFVWYTNFESRKAQEMSHNPFGALSFWWSEVQRAVRIEGVVCKVTEKESTEYYQSRPRGSQVGAWALHQSRPVESRGSLEANVKEVQNKFKSIRDVPRPPHFGGFRLRPDRIEFWKGRQTRIHDRLVYVIMDDKWIMQRLQP
ncbi:unnamed protein product [Pylaiella littoralis]